MNTIEAKLCYGNIVNRFLDKPPQLVIESLGRETDL